MTVTRSKGWAQLRHQGKDIDMSKPWKEGDPVPDEMLRIDAQSVIAKLFQRLAPLMMFELSARSRGPARPCFCRVSRLLARSQCRVQFQP